jgi:2-oxoglutarate dehydrogenase E2 component (dihydrolipoamide succinyltransferase)
MIKSQPKKETDEDKAADLSSDANRKPFEIKGDNVEDAKIGFLSPLVMNIARKENISPKELTLIKGTGIGGRIRKQDILDYCEKKKSKGVKITSPASDHPAKVKSTATNAEMHAMYKLPGIQVLQMDNLQQKMSDHMVMSVHTSPHVSATAECDMSAVFRLRKELNEEFYGKEGFKLTYMPFICDAVVKALKDFPLVNSSIDGRNILIKKFINLGIAVAMDNGGLIVPVIKNADSMNYIGIARAINDLSGRARIKKLTLEEIQDGTFTISNYGIFGNDTGIPIINQPQIAILGTGAVKKRAVVIENHDNDSIAIKPTMYLTLSFDHRLIDGALGGKFLMKIIEYLQNYTL